MVNHGWYQFDGVSNKISVHNASKEDQISIQVEANTQVKNTEGENLPEQPTYNKNLSFGIYKDNNWNCFEGHEDGNNSKVIQKVEPKKSIDFYLSVSGKLEDDSIIERNIGSITINISE